MIKKLFTVVSWQDGVASLNYKVNRFCKNCKCNIGCDIFTLDIICLSEYRLISVASKKQLIKGQKVELGIAESALLISTILVYLFPLVGLFVLASLFQAIFSTDIAAICGSIFGGTTGFILARYFFKKLIKREDWQPIILELNTSSDVNVH